MTSKKTEYERDFAAAMQTKLRLNRKARAQQPEQQSPIVQAALAYRDLREKAEAIGRKTAPPLTLDDLDDLTASIVKNAMRENPELTIETALEMLREFGAY